MCKENFQLLGHCVATVQLFSPDGDAIVINDTAMGILKDLEFANIDRDDSKELISVTRQDNHVNWHSDADAKGDLFYLHRVFQVKGHRSIGKLSSVTVETVGNGIGVNGSSTRR